MWFQVPSLDWDLQGGGDFDCLVSGEEKGVVGLVGLEPTITPLWAVRFNQLNYKPLRISTCNSLTSGRADGKRRPLLYLLLPFPRNEQLDKKNHFFDFICFLFIDGYRINYIYYYYNIMNKRFKLSKRPFRDSNCRSAFRLATAQTGGGSLFACNAGCSPLVKSRSIGRRLPHTSEKVKKYEYEWSKKKHIRSEKEKLGYGNRRLGRLL